MAATKHPRADGGAEHDAESSRPAKKLKKAAEADSSTPQVRTKEQMKLELRKRRRDQKKEKKEKRERERQEKKAKRARENALANRSEGKNKSKYNNKKKTQESATGANAQAVNGDRMRLQEDKEEKPDEVTNGVDIQDENDRSAKSKLEEEQEKTKEVVTDIDAQDDENDGEILKPKEKKKKSKKGKEAATEIDAQDEPKKKSKKSKESAAEIDIEVEPKKKSKKSKESSTEIDVQDEPKKKTKSKKSSTGFQRKRSYREAEELHSLPKADIEAYLSTHSITITDVDSSARQLRPITKFDYLPATDLLAKRPFQEYKVPTPIQAASWPYTLSGRDVIGVAETGSGKTMAFALPCIEAVLKMGSKGVKAIIVSPTRELAMQTHAQLEILAGLVGLSCVCIFGGASKTTQRAELERGADIITATPGRLKDFMSDGSIELSGAHFAVLDEADRMLDTGFEQDIKDILSSAPPREQRQTMMFTATWPASVQALAASFMVDPVKITIGSGGKETVNGAVELQANMRITQRIEVVEHNDKERRLLEILKQRQQGKARYDRILVFCLYKKEASRVEAFLRQRGIRVGSIHGDLKQEQRTKSLEAFKTGQTPVLVATDVAARGLDIPEVKLVINVTFPLTIEDYVHRIGRTGRAGKDGEAITMFTEGDKSHSGSLINILKGANQPVPDELLKFGTTVKKKEHGTYGAFFKDVDMTKTATKITFDD